LIRFQYSHFDPFSDGLQEVAGWAVIEPPLALFEKQMEVDFWYAVITAHMPLCLVSEILNPVYVIFLFDEFFGMIDPNMVEF